MVIGLAPLGLRLNTAAYIALFSMGWLLALAVFALVNKKQNRILAGIIAAVPVVNFVIFFIINFTWGNPAKGLARYGLYFVASLVLCLAALMLSKGKKPVRRNSN